jgi:glycine cleavage system aminomethyltransferase T
MVEAGLMRFFAESKDDFEGKDATLDVLDVGASTEIVY